MRILLAMFIGILSLNFSVHAQKQKDFSILRMNGKLKPEAGIRADMAHARKDAKDASKVVFEKEQYYLLQFEEMPTNAQKQALENSGVSLLGYYPNYA